MSVWHKKVEQRLIMDFYNQPRGKHERQHYLGEKYTELIQSQSAVLFIWQLCWFKVNVLPSPSIHTLKESHLSVGPAHLYWAGTQGWSLLCKWIFIASKDTYTNYTNQSNHVFIGLKRKPRAIRCLRKTVWMRPSWTNRIANPKEKTKKREEL